MESAMDVFENRLESFTNWPKGLFLRPQVMAAAGFVHTNWDTDEVQCFNCAIVIEDWHQDDDPFKQHLAAAPNCSFVNKTYMRSLEDRLASFHAWPLDDKPLPIHMAAAGFFRTNSNTDAATCFCCTLRLEHWDQADDPIQRHMFVQSQTRGRPCTWLDKITTPPEKVLGPIPQRVAARWNHSTAPPKSHKCGICQTVYSSGTQFQRHLVEAKHMLPRRVARANPPPASGSGVNRPKRVSSRQQRPGIQPRARERPSRDSNVTQAPSATQVADSAAHASNLATTERRRKPSGTIGFLGSHRIMKPSAKSRPNARANSATNSSRMGKFTGLLKEEDDLTPIPRHEAYGQKNGTVPRQVEVTQDIAPTARAAGQERQEPLPVPRPEWDAPRQPRQESLIGDYGESSAVATDWNSVGVVDGSGW